jgi:rubrerythrin
MAHRFAAQEAEHAGALSAMVKRLGGTPVKPQRATFPVATKQDTLSTASSLENIGAGAYLGQIDRAQSKEVLALLLSIHTVEGRHAAAISKALGHSPTPDGPFAAPISAEDVQGQIQTYLAG